MNTTIRFLIFFYDAKEDRHHRLAAVTPLFSSPSAIKTLMKTAKFVGRPSLVVTGSKEQLEILISKVERLDVTDWLKLEEWSEIEAQLKSTVQSIEGLSVYETYRDDDEQVVFGDEIVLGKYYPTDLPAQNRSLWDSVYDTYKKLMKGDEDTKAAIHRRLYTEIAHRQGVVPWVSFKPNGHRSELVEKLVSGEAKASALLEKLARHSISEGHVKSAKSVKFYGADKDHEGHSVFNLTHEVVWTLAKNASWKDLVKYLLGKEAFNVLGPRMLTLSVNQVTDVEIYGSDTENKVVIHIVHPLTHSQIVDLVGADLPDPVKELNRIGRLWHEKGKFPN